MSQPHETALVEAYLGLFRAQDNLREVQEGVSLAEQLRLKQVALEKRLVELQEDDAKRLNWVLCRSEK
jgi:hypothetical protein